MKEYILTETDIKEALEFLDPISPQQVPASTEDDPWGSESFFVITLDAGEEFILL